MRGDCLYGPGTPLQRHPPRHGCSMSVIALESRASQAIAHAHRGNASVRCWVCIMVTSLLHRVSCPPHASRALSCSMRTRRNSLPDAFLGMASVNSISRTCLNVATLSDERHQLFGGRLGVGRATNALGTSPASASFLFQKDALQFGRRHWKPLYFMSSHPRPCARYRRCAASRQRRLFLPSLRVAGSSLSSLAGLG